MAAFPGCFFIEISPIVGLTWRTPQAPSASGYCVFLLASDLL